MSIESKVILVLAAYSAMRFVFNCLERLFDGWLWNRLLVIQSISQADHPK
jgi:hypothetical protein